jgi:organic radical activating enzyme
MKDMRISFLDGIKPNICKSCYYEDSHAKISGRLCQLAKSGIDINNFEKTLCASPHYSLFEHSFQNQGNTEYLPTDFQIDLGNGCNNSCIMCFPSYSSRLAEDYKKLNKIDSSIFPKPTPYANWADNPILLDKFIDELVNIPNIRYLHFIGGEPLYLKSFYKICKKLIDAGVSKNIHIGTTTNCTIYSEELEDIIKHFSNFHLGMSIESFHPINDYVRWPSKFNQVSNNIDNFLKLRKLNNVDLALRITPSVFSVYHLDTVFKFMLDNSIIAESSSILWEPSCLRMELLPRDIIAQIVKKIDILIDQYNLKQTNELTVNRRHRDMTSKVITDEIYEYKNFLETIEYPENLEQERHKLVKFTKAFEQLRGNSILEVLPEYEEFLRSYGY